MASFVRVALAGAGTFALLDIVDGDTLGHLVSRVCVKYPHWGKADKLSLYLVADGGDEEPAVEAISAVLSSGGRLGVGWSLTRAGISSGAWLVARKVNDAATVAAVPSGSAFCFSALRTLMHHSCAQFYCTLTGNSPFSAASGILGAASSSRLVTAHESRVLFGRQEHENTVGGHLPRRMLNFGVDSGKCVGGTLKEE
jgi:hypothetical protein